MMQIVWGVVMITVAFLIFPLILTGADSTRTATNIAYYTGLSSLVTIGPTLAFISLILGGLISGGVGVYNQVKGARKSKAR